MPMPRDTLMALLFPRVGAAWLCREETPWLYWPDGLYTGKFKSCFQAVVPVLCPTGCFLLTASRAWASYHVCVPPNCVSPHGKKHLMLSKAGVQGRSREE